MVFFLYLICGDIRERKNYGVFIYFVSDTSGKYLNYDMIKVLSIVRF